jgi:isopenicillin N synthase-like dioxygenase
MVFGFADCDTDVKEAFTMGDCFIDKEQRYTEKTGKQPPAGVTQAQNIWPSKAAWWREGLYEYYNQVFPLAMKLVKILALAFDLDESAFDSMFSKCSLRSALHLCFVPPRLHSQRGTHHSQPCVRRRQLTPTTAFPITGMRPLYYPPTPITSDAASVGLGAHSDFSWLTLVLQDSVPALEVLNQDGIWVDAPPQPGTFVCNVGQYLERQTNGIFPATVHRVRNKTGGERYSLPFFLTPDIDAVVDVLDGCVQRQGGERKYEAVNVGDLYIRRILPARKKHPTSIKFRDVPEKEWKYDMLLS